MENSPKTTTFYMTVGVPGSGKSSWTKTLPQDVRVYSSDAIRAELWKNEKNQKQKNVVFETLHKRLLADLNAGVSCVYDATNVNRKRRMSFLKLVPAGVKKVCVLFLTAPAVCEERDRNRCRTVGAGVIDGFLRAFQCPDFYEGWDEILPIMDETPFTLPMEKMADFSQDNPHHSLTLGEHMRQARAYCVEKGFSEEVKIAAAYHDCGKYYTKKFESSRGYPTEYAHFYGHENYSAYVFLLDAYQENGIWKYGSFRKTLTIAQIINWHMRPYETWDKSEKLLEEDRKLFGEKLVDAVRRFHEADRFAH